MAASLETVSVAADLAQTARRFAESRHCSLSELTEEALRSFLGLTADQTPSVQEHLRRALQMGLTPDEYAVLLVKETRRERRAEGEPQSAS